MEFTCGRTNGQEKYRLAGLETGTGEIKQSKHGAFIIYARASVKTILETIQVVRPELTHLEQLKTVFLIGPTPTFCGVNKATTSWRREFVQYLDEADEFDDTFMIVLPEPFNCDWASVDYPNLVGIEHVFAQVHWENEFIDLAVKTGITVLHSHFRWKGNAGPTARLEAGKVLSLIKENKVKCCVINLPKDSQTVQYIETHLHDAIKYAREGRFLLSECSPLELDWNLTPRLENGTIQESGVHDDGSSSKDRLFLFFKCISKMAIALNKGVFI